MRWVLKKLPLMAMQCCCMRDQARGLAYMGAMECLEFVVEAGGFDGFGFAVFDGPAGGVFGAAFDPPAVEDRE